MQTLPTQRLRQKMETAESTRELVSYNMRHDATFANKTPESSREQERIPIRPLYLQSSQALQGAVLC